MANQESGHAIVMEEPNLADSDLHLNLNDLSKPEISSTSYVKPVSAETNEDEDSSRALSQVMKQKTQEDSFSTCEMKVEMMYCCSCSYCDVDSDRMKIHIFRKHPKEAAIVTNTLDKVDCNIIGIRLFCIRENCTFSSVVCSAYEEHLMSCCPLQQSFPGGEIERLRSTLKFLLDFHSRHSLSLSAASEFLDYVTCLDTAVMCKDYVKVERQISANLDNYSPSVEKDQGDPKSLFSTPSSLGSSKTLNMYTYSKVDETDMHANTTSSVIQQGVGNEIIKQEQYTTLHSCTKTKTCTLPSVGAGEVAFDQTSDNHIVSEAILPEIGKARLPSDSDTSPSKQVMEEDSVKEKISIYPEICCNNNLDISNHQAGKILSFHCNECGKTFSCENNLNSHTRIHTTEKTFQCKECGKTFSHKGHLNSHTRIHTGEKPFQCKECGKTFSHKGHLNRHTRIHTGEKTFHCKECGKTFSHKGRLKVHMRYIHTGDKIFQCKECGKTFSCKRNLRSHTRIHRPTAHKKFQCKECGKTFSHKGHLNRHTSIHTAEKTFHCKECGKTFSHKGRLKVHIRYIHTGDKIFQCKECGKTFSCKSYLRSHTRIHTRPFQCNECGKTFSCRRNLNSHIGIHTGERPFKCNECGRTFFYKVSLRIHTRVHTGERPLQCNECGKTFSCKSSLNPRKAMVLYLGRAVST